MTKVITKPGNVYGKNSWEIQSSDNKDVQSIIDHGFWVEEVVGNQAIAYIYGIGGSEVDVFGSLPRLLYMTNEGNNRIKVVFEIDE